MTVYLLLLYARLMPMFCHSLVCPVSLPQAAEFLSILLNLYEFRLLNDSPTVEASAFRPGPMIHVKLSICNLFPCCGKLLHTLHWCWLKTGHE